MPFVQKTPQLNQAELYCRIKPREEKVAERDCARHRAADSPSAALSRPLPNPPVSTAKTNNLTVTGGMPLVVRVKRSHIAVFCSLCQLGFAMI